MNNINHTNGKFVIRKSFHKQRKYFGIYDTLEEAERVRDLLIKNNWDMSCLPYTPKKQKGENRYIVKTKDKGYTIIKRIGNKQTYFGRFDNIEDAREERDLLEENEWDYENICSM